MRINYNVQAMNANLALNKADNKVSQSISRLSSGQKISVAKDDPSGYAISKRMNLQLQGLSRATQSSNDAISVINIADGALSEVSDMIQRMSELSVKAANGTMTDEDRQICQEEIDQLKSEVKRVASTTQFNGQTLLDGSFDLKGYTDNDSIKVATYNDTTTVSKYRVTGISLIAATDEDGNALGYLDEDKTKEANQNVDLKIINSDNTETVIKNAQVKSVDGKMVQITGDDGFDVTLSFTDDQIKANTVIGDTTLDITGIGAMDMQIGTNEDQIIAIRIPEMSLELMSIDDLDVSTAEGAEKGISDLGKAMDYLNSMRSDLGAYENRLEHTVSTLDVTNEAMTSAYSGLVDVDMSEETVNYTSQQVISQAATSILAQANDRPSQALQLLQ